MNAMVNFIRDMRRMPVGWQLWLGLLMAVNLLGGLVYAGTLEGQVVLAVLAVSAAVMMALHKLLGFVRLLGLGHFAWFPLVVWLLTRLEAAPADGAFQAWLWAVILLDSASLVIDVVDVARWLRGERAPTVG